MSAFLKKRAHLGFIQDIINRTVYTCLLIKVINIVTVIGSLFMYINEYAYDVNYLPLLFIVIFCWYFDGNYLRKEEMYRRLYTRVTETQDEYVTMNLSTIPFENTVSRSEILFSGNMIACYGTSIFIIIFITFVR